MDKKLTDDEIMNCFEWIKKCSGNLLKHCIGCPLQKHYPYCHEKLLDISFDLINRLQAENERLKSKLEPQGFEEADPMDFCGVLCDFAEGLIDKAKTEAYKEFAERLKEHFPSYDEPYQYWEIHEFADNLLKEMIGE